MKLKLMGKVLVLTLVPVIIGITALTYIGSTLTSRGIYEVADVQLLEFAGKQASEIDNIIENVVSLADMTDSNGDIEKITALAKQFGNTKNNSPEYLEAQKIANAVLAELVENFEDVVSATIIDLEGMTLHTQFLHV